MTAFELADKVVLITGGTGGLGSATARSLLSRGARVGIVDLRPDTPQIAAHISSSNAVGFTADVCDRSALDDAVAHLCERFGRVDVADTSDADGLLFQYGNHAFEGPPVFTLNLVRQFEINDASGEHDHHIQLHCELRYAPVPQLRALGHFETWFFHDTDDELDAWADSLRRQEFWPIVRNFHSQEIRVHQEQA